jgi:hypothetical protein
MKKLSILLLTYIAVLSAQVDTGAISGLVKDASGATIPAVRVVVSNEATNIAQ